MALQDIFNNASIIMTVVSLLTFIGILLVDCSGTTSAAVMMFLMQHRQSAVCR